MVLLFAFPIVFVEEGLKFVGRRRQKLKQIAHEMKVKSFQELANLRHGPMVPSPMF